MVSGGDNMLMNSQTSGGALLSGSEVRHSGGADMFMFLIFTLPELCDPLPFFS